MTGKITNAYMEYFLSIANSVRKGRISFNDALRAIKNNNLNKDQIREMIDRLKQEEKVRSGEMERKNI